MPLTIEEFDIAPHCKAGKWVIKDEDKLAHHVAILLMGRYGHVINIIKNIDSKPPKFPKLSIDYFIEILSVKGKDKDATYHRDGLIFQMISWIAAQKNCEDNAILKAPHAQPTQKGFDGLILQLTPSSDGISHLTICEDKATENCRQIIRTEVWPEFEEIEKGGRETEITNEVTALLQRARLDDEKVEEILDNIRWNDNKRYRVSITTNRNSKNTNKMDKLFKNYEEIIKGDIERRKGEILYSKDIRSWMEKFCKKVIKELKKMEQDV